MKKYSSEDLGFIILSLVLAGYTFIRAASASITHDEVGGYYGYSIHPVMDIIRFTNLQLGNHVLNSLLVKLTTYLFGVSEFTLRLPNLIGHLLYLYFSWRIIRLLTKDIILAIAGFIFVNFNPYLLDFFSLSRGYGLEVSMMVVSIYLLMKFRHDGKPGLIWGSMIMSALGVLSNFTFIPVYFCIILLINFLVLVDLIRQKNTFKTAISALLKVNVPVLIVSAALAALVVGPIIRLEEIGEFSARANKEGFWDNMFRSVIRHSLYGQYGDSLQFTLTTVIKVSSAVIVLILAWYIFKDKWEATKSGFFLVFSLLAVICLWFFLQHIVLGSRYPHQRTALFILPLFLFALIACLDYIILLRGFKIPIQMITALAAVFFLLHFFNSANFKYYFDWPHDAETKYMLAQNMDPMKKSLKGESRKLNLGTYWLCRPGFIFYLDLKKIDWINLVNYRETFQDPADYYYIPREYHDSLMKFNPEKIIDYPVSRTVLYREMRAP